MNVENFKTEGWVKLHRKFFHWGWYRDSHMVHLFIHFMLRANRMEGKWRGLTIRRGQLAIGVRSLSRDTGISQRSIRTCLKRMTDTQEITVEPTHVASIITITNYHKYNTIESGVDYNEGKRKKTEPTHRLKSKKPTDTGIASDKQEPTTLKKATHQSTRKPTHQPTHHKINGKPVLKGTTEDEENKTTLIPTHEPTQESTTNKKYKNIKNIKNIKPPENEFREAVKKSDFIQQIIDQFCVSYFTEHGFEYDILNPAKERAAAAKILQVYKKQNPDSDTLRTLKELGEYFSACVGIKERWLSDNMSLPIINSKFNQIKNILLNGKDRSDSKKGGVTDRELAEIIARKFAVEK
jgi:hypothetical protein